MWAEVLHAVPESVLFVKARSTGDDTVRARLVRKLGELGIAPERVETAAYTGTQLAHLQLYHAADIALDTFPYNGTTTTCEAFSMGVPVVTRSGTTHASRVGKSLVRAIGRSEWCASDRAEYVAIARSLASDRLKLAEIRAGLRQELLASELCDGNGLCRELEAMYARLLSALS
jgi:hypothetical protein